MVNRQELFNQVKSEIGKRPFAKRNITAPPSSGLSYLRYRLLRPYYKFKYGSYQKNHPTEPWLCPDAILAIKRLLNGGKGIEYGSGRSTVFFSQLLDELHSIEHHQQWSEKVIKMLEEKSIKNTTLHLLKADQKLTDHHFSSEQQFFMTEEEYPVKDEIFSTYINYLDQVTDASVDFILVDGRARKSCALKAMSKIKIGGILVLDNSERTRYQAVHDNFAHYPSIFTTTGLTDTTIWLKA